MANTKLAAFLEHVSHDQNAREIFDRIPTRLTGDLAVGTVIALSTSASETVRVKGASRVRVRVKLSGSGAASLTIGPMLADGNDPPTTAAATNIETTAGITTTEVSDDFDNYGSEWILVKLTETGGAASVTVVYVEVEML